ncbi:MAG: hypothetical protein KDF65_05160, partial [Anaerolineae bacterium]|nr:hypothetical protein [Anaerolineae bacterium]
TVASTQTPVPPTLVPATATVNPPATATPTSRLFFSATNYSVAEGDTSALITVQFAPANAAQTITVNYSTSNSSATAPADYAASGGTLTFAPGQTSQTFSVPIVDDLLDELDETLTLSLSAAVNAELGSPNPANLTIIDNDNAPTVAFERLTFTVLENAPAGQATITAILSSASAWPVSVNYRTDNGSATAPADYAAASGTLTFSPGQTSQSFSVPIVNDALNEFDETVNLTLSNPLNASLGSPNPATLFIQEDDFPTLQFEQPAYSIVETNGLAVITTTLSSSSARLITATYASSDLTALAGVDYLTSTGTITLAPGSTSTTFTVPIIDDVLTNEFTETVRLTLSNPVNASLGSQNPAPLSIIDDDGQPVVSFATAAYSVNEGDDGGTGVITHPITVILAAPSALTVTVTYADAGSGSASAGTDYVNPIGGTLTFAPNQTGQSFDVVVISDTLNEANETINLTLTNPTEAALGLASTTVSIINDDAPGALPCSGPSDAGEPDVGPPDGQYSRVGCGGELVIDLGTTPIQTDGTSGYDLVYYEREEPAAIPPIIFMDWVVVQVGSTSAGPWYTVFYWGDGLADDNSNVGQFLANPTNETDNRQIFTTNPPLYGPVGPLNLTTGIAIDVDARAPAGTYPFVRFFVPLGGGNDVVEIDAVQPLP